MPWKNGFWHTKTFSSRVMVVKDNQAETKYHVVFDYPDSKSLFSSTLTNAKFVGEFGLADNNIFEASGVKYSNLKFEYMLGAEKVAIFGVLNDTGTTMYLKLQGKI